MAESIPPARRRRSPLFFVDTTPSSSRVPLLKAKKRQFSTNSSPPKSLSVDTISSASLPSSGSASATAALSISEPSSWMTTALNPASTPGLSTEGAQQPDNTPAGPDIKSIVFGVVGGVIGVGILLVVLYRLLRRHRDPQHTVFVSAEKGESGNYLPVHDQFVNQELTTRPGTKARARWQSFTPWRMLSGLLSTLGKHEVRTKNGAKRKQRPRTLYKVRNHKPGGSFEIDSEVASSIVDLSVKD